MRVFKILLLCLFLAAPCFAANGDITACRIKGTEPGNGWVLQIDIESSGATPINVGGTYAMGLGTNNDPATAKTVLTVTSLGFDATGAATTVSRTVYGTVALRKPYPDQATMNEALAAGVLTLEVALSDFVYVKDKSGVGNSGTDITIAIASGLYTQGGQASSAFSGTVTNNGTLAYPKVIGHFPIEQRRPVNGTQTIEVFAVHKYGQNGKPVAKVAVTATGATSAHVESGTATAMTLSARGDKIPVYAIPLNLSVAAGFTRGELININFTAYPWVGDATSILDSTTDGEGLYQICPLKWTIMDKMIAVVDPANGVDASCVASLVQSEADAAPCLTISGALTKIAAANNTAYFLNRTDGGEVQLYAGTYKTGKYSTQAVTNGYFTIRPHSSTNRAGVVFDGYVTSQSQYLYQRYYNVTINRPGNGFIVFAGNDAAELIMESVNLADAYTGWYSGRATSNIEFLDCITSNSYLSKGGNDGHSRLNRNCMYTAPSGAQIIVGDASCILGLKGSGSTSNIWNGLGVIENNIVIAYTKWISKTDGYFIIPTGGYAMTNIAIINNLVERIGVSTAPMAEISSANHANVLIVHNTLSGQRFNHENDITAPYANNTLTDYIGKFNILNARGDHRADIRDTDGSMTGTWSVGYSVGWAGNHNEAISYSGDTDFWGLNSNTDTGSDSGTAIIPSSAAGYVGNGDYHLTAAANARRYLVPFGKAVLPFDLDGNPRYNDGRGSAGAYEYRIQSGNALWFGDF